MSSNIIELVARFRDLASAGLRRLRQESERARRDRNRSSGPQNAYNRLGIRSEQQIRREILRTQAAYNRLARSGRASQAELARAAAATRNRIRELNNELGGAASRMHRLRAAGGRLAGGIARGAAAATAGAYVLAQPVKRTMDYDMALRHAANTMYAGKSLNEKYAGMREIDRTVTDAAVIGGSSKDSALETMNTMVASGAMSDEAVKQLLPLVMKTAAAANADSNDIAAVVTKALQMGFKESDIPALLDRAIQSGADGGFELNNMARWLPTQLAGMKAAGMLPTLDNFSTILSANQLAYMSAGSADEAGNNVANLLQKIPSQDIIAKAKKVKINGLEGFDFTGSINRRQADGMNSLDALVDVLREVVAKDEKSAALMKQINAAQGDEAKLALLESQMALVSGTAVGQLVSDKQALMALLPLLSNQEAAQRLKAGQANAAGAVEGAYALVSQGSGHKTEAAKAVYADIEFQAFKGLNDRLGEAASHATDWMRRNPEQAKTGAQLGWGAAAGAAGYGAWRGAGALGLGGSAGGGSGMLSATLPRLLGVAGLLTYSPTLGDGYSDLQKAIADGRQQRERQMALLSAQGRLYQQSLPHGNPFIRDGVGAVRAPQSTMPLDSFQLKSAREQQFFNDQAARRPEIEARLKAAEDARSAAQTQQQAAADNQAAASQLQDAATMIVNAANQIQAAAGKPIPVTVTVQNGNIAAFVSQIAARDNRKN